MSILDEYKELQTKIVERKKDFDDFITFLETQTTWLTAPASIRHHLNCEQGLLTFYRGHKHPVTITNIPIKSGNL
jgi:hypothetical protein